MRAEREFDTCVECDQDFSVNADGTVRTHGPANRRCSGSRRLGIQSQRDTRIALGWERASENKEPRK